MHVALSSQLWRYARQSISVVGIVALSVSATLLTQQLLIPSTASAQATQLQELRGSKFVLVAADGTELARLEPGGDGNGRLQLFDKTGVMRVSVAGGGAINIMDTDGTTQRFRAGFVPYVDSAGRPAINGVWLDEDGTVDVVPR
jgi:hypothetical protein